MVHTSKIDASNTDEALAQDAWKRIKHKMATVKVPVNVKLEDLLLILYLLGEQNESA